MSVDVTGQGIRRVLVDASCLKKEQGGVRSYTLGLAHALARRSELSVGIATPFPDDVDGGPIEIYPISVDVGPPLRRLLWREVGLRTLVRDNRFDVVVVPLHEQPLRALSIPTVMVMLDLGPLVAPALYGRTRWARYLLTLPHALKVASAIVSISNATYADLFANFHVDQDKCHVIEPGTKPLPEPDSTFSLVDGDFALYVGTLMPHKNIETLVRAFAADDGRLPSKLVLVGPHLAPEQTRVNEAARKCGLRSERLVQLGYVPASTLSALYRQASVCVLPSLHEGFGMPIIEAMRIGIPSLVSDIPPHREVARDAARYVSELLSPNAWRDAIGEICHDAELREVLREQGRRRADYYTWERAGAEWARLLVSLVPADPQ